MLHAITGATSGWLCYVRSFQRVSIRHIIILCLWCQVIGGVMASIHCFYHIYSIVAVVVTLCNFVPLCCVFVLFHDCLLLLLPRCHHCCCLFVLSFPYLEHACLYFSVFIPHPDITIMADWALKIVIYPVFVFYFQLFACFRCSSKGCKVHSYTLY